MVVSLQVVMLIDLVGLVELTTALGLTNMFYGIGTFVGPPLAGIGWVDAVMRGFLKCSSARLAGGSSSTPPSPTLDPTCSSFSFFLFVAYIDSCYISQPFEVSRSITPFSRFRGRRIFTLCMLHKVYCNGIVNAQYGSDIGIHFTQANKMKYITVTVLFPMWTTVGRS